MADRFTDNARQSRFELDVDGTVAFADYRRASGGLQILHVEAPAALRGTGAASRLMEHIAATARAESLPIIPWCGYAASWLRKHSDA